MAIYIYTGAPGSGKSLHATKVVLDKIFMRKRIVMNYAVKLPKRHQKIGRVPVIWNNSDVTVDNLIQFSLDNHKWISEDVIAEEHQTLIVLDECQLLFGKNHIGTKADMARWTEFFTQHRKYGYDIILITQHIKIIYEDVRELLEVETMHFKWDDYAGGSLIREPDVQLDDIDFCSVNAKSYYIEPIRRSFKYVDIDTPDCEDLPDDCFDVA